MCLHPVGQRVPSNPARPKIGYVVLAPGLHPLWFRTNFRARLHRRSKAIGFYGWHGFTSLKNAKNYVNIAFMDDSIYSIYQARFEQIEILGYQNGLPAFTARYRTLLKRVA